MECLESVQGRFIENISKLISKVQFRFSGSTKGQMGLRLAVGQQTSIQFSIEMEILTNHHLVTGFFVHLGIKPEVKKVELLVTGCCI
jgi:hypothetical protein